MEKGEAMGRVIDRGEGSDYAKVGAVKCRLGVHTHLIKPKTTGGFPGFCGKCNGTGIAPPGPEASCVFCGEPGRLEVEDLRHWDKALGEMVGKLKPVIHIPTPGEIQTVTGKPPSTPAPGTSWMGSFTPQEVDVMEQTYNQVMSGYAQPIYPQYPVPAPAWNTYPATSAPPANTADVEFTFSGPIPVPNPRTSVKLTGITNLNGWYGCDGNGNEQE